MPRARTILIAGCAIAAAACHKKPERTGIDALDNELANGAVVAESRDAKALRDAIHVNPARTGGQATSAAEPTKIAAVGGSQNGACLSRYGDKLAYAKAWAGKMPPQFPAVPKATVTDAAGHDGGCAIRIVSYAVPGDAEAVLGWYAAKARAGGYTADRGDTGGDKVLAGTRGAAAYYITAGPATGGATPVDLVWAATG